MCEWREQDIYKGYCETEITKLDNRLDMWSECEGVEDDTNVVRFGDWKDSGALNREGQKRRRFGRQDDVLSFEPVEFQIFMGHPV